MTAMTARIVLTGLILLLTGGSTAAQVHVNGSVYGGGNLADVGGSVTVNMRTGTVAKDVYGGGALANTNTENWNPNGVRYEQVSVIVDETDVTGLYEESGGNYTETEDEKAVNDKTYYQKIIGTWADGKSSATNTTTVNLTGGTINGDAYGGGLGRIAESVHYTQAEADAYNKEHNLSSVDAGFKTTDDWQPEVKATVYGDINVSLGKTDASSATKFIISEYSDGHSDVMKSGRVFGCNNLNGSPQGNVTVTVYTTVTGNRGKTPAGTDGKAPKTVSSATIYRVAAVYGGGNLANYEPTATNKKSHVIIYGCDETSIGYVYGGGNAAAVPETAVDIYAAYEIGYVFGGGNGKDEYTLDGSTWKTNPGANVNGNANTMLYGGTIHEAFGGSNEKGTISGSVYINTDDTNSDCDLDVGKLYGAGKNADIEGDLKIILGCKTKRTEEVYGGAENANVKGNVELTITSGEFGKVFGGNNQSGAIFGHIILNIEETGCRPIEIDELYLGGNQAAYSVYGYYKGEYYLKNDGNYYLDVAYTIPLYQNDGKLYLDAEKTKRLYPKTEEGHNYLYLDEEYQKPLYRPRTSASDGTAVTFTGLPNTNPNATSAGQYDNPELNIISCTRIGKVFGGGLGEGAVIYGSPTVNINQIFGIQADANNPGSTELGEIGGSYVKDGETVEGGVFGGGNQAKVIGNTTVNIGTKTTVDLHRSVDANGEYTMLQNQTVKGAKILSNVYGGGNLADVTEKTQVNICAAYNSTTKKWESVDEGTKKVNIAGNVYGGGKGVAKEEYDAGAFFCAEAMVGVNNTNSAANNNNSTYADNGTHVRIGHGTVGTLNAGTLVDGTGNVYGGGEIGRVEFHTEVIIGLGTATEETPKSPVILGSVFGAGKGVKTHGYSGLVRGDSKVSVQAAAKVGHSVYGGGEVASVGKYDLVNGLPKTPVFGGKCTVTIQGYAEIGPDGMQMTKTGGPDDTGHIFGAGKGILPYEGVTGTPWSMQTTSKVTYDNNYQVGEDGLGYEASYYKFIQSLGLASNTYVTIGDHAFVKGSVYGGSENGYVQADTHVTIAGGQIGEGLGQTAPYADNAFINPSDPATPVTTSNALATCATWTYDQTTTGKPYDKYATHLKDGEYYYDAEFTNSSKGGSYIATDGHTYYGNVFGGGSGVIPFAAGKWHRAAGSVGGDTQVNIIGGHILSSVYGGNEHTDVGSYELGSDGEPTTTLTKGGSCTINISGGTVGVPRTQSQIEANPVIGNVFGAGKGDKRVLFNTWTNVGTTSVNISGTARVYGSVFGGGEDGHVMNNAVTNIGGTVTIGETSYTHSNVVIGSTGISGADGNVFGGGRGSETAKTAGVVGGNVTLTINNGKILGSVYGGGRLASVGTHFVNPTIPDPNDGTQVIDNPDYGKMQSGDTHGHVTVYINGGFIGTSTATGVNGNIFGASKGTVTDFDLGIVKSTKINMTGGTAYASVYGGGELAQVVESHTASGQALGTEINISGGTIGMAKSNLPEGTTYGATYGNVYGGGKGNTTHVEAGLIKTNTKVSISQASGKTTLVRHNIYGGGAYGSVGTFTYYGETTEYATEYDKYKVGGTAPDADKLAALVAKKNDITGWTSGGTAYIAISGGTIGEDGHENGMIFGSSRGDIGAPGEIHDKLAWVYDTEVTVNDGQINGSIYGGGENGHVYHDAAVNVHGGTIGMTTTPDADRSDDLSTDYDGANYPYRGNVYGGGCGTDKYYTTTTGVADPHDGNGNKYNPLAGIVYGDATVIIDGGHVVHNVYGAGAMGSVGTITNFDDLDDATKNYKHDDETTDDHKSLYNFGLSWPYELTYGNTGLTKVTIRGNAVIGVDGSTGGHVYGAARGSVNVGETDITKQRYEEAKLANVREVQVVIGTEGGSSTTTTPTIHGSVYGGGEDGHVNENASVIIHHGTIAHSVFGGGKGTSTYTTTLWDIVTKEEKTASEDVHSWTAGKVYGNTTITMNGGSVGYSIYGGGNMASVGKGNYAGGSDDYSTIGYGELGSKNNDGTGGPIWTSTSNSDYAYSFLHSGLATVNIYGGIVGAATTTYGDLPTGNVFGSSRGVAALSCNNSPRYKYVPDFFLGYVNQTSVTIGKPDGGTTPTIYGSVYGGGENGHVRRSTEVIINKGTIGVENDATANKLDRGNVFGAGSGVGKNSSNDYNSSSGSVTCTTTVTVNNGTIFQNVYGGGAQGSVGPPPGGITADETNLESSVHKTYTKVEINGGNIGSTNNAAGYGGNVYGASRGNASLNAAVYATDVWSTVNVTNGIINGSVFGGGESGIVKCSVAVNISGGTIAKDVYGGGALADTNTSNDTNYGKTGGASIASTATYTTTVNLLGGTVKGDAYGGGLGRLEKAAVEGTKFTQEEINAAQEGDDAYGKTTGDWKVEPVAAVTAIPATVYGDITVQLGDDTFDSETNAYTPVNATKFYLTKYDGTDIVKSGRIFGCNNLNGSPQGSVTVDVFKTEKGSTQRTVITRGQDGKIATKAEPSTYEVAAVYGGGNLANYAPTATGKKTNVIIETCDVSIETVYGGGNAADVPGTDVLVKGAHEINEVFGGGNGQDDYTLDNGATWNTNEGADVNGNAITLLKGGFIHEAYGGSNSKGTISGNVSITKDSGGACPLEVSEVYGAGKNADVEGDLILVMGCSESRTEAIYGCSKNANVKGNVELTITSGEYGKVFGGNNESGAIFGHIKVNIEEVGCSPIIIDELYGCGNDAAYSVYGYYKGQYYQKDGNYYLDAAFTIPLYQNDGKLYLDAEKTQRLYPKTEEGHNYLYLDAEYQKPLYRPRTSASDGTAVTFTGKPHTDPNATSAGQYDDPEVNIISCTRIGKVFGGGYGVGATVYGNPKVNINMIKGAWANRTYGSVTYLDALGKVGDGYQYTDEITNELVQDKGGVFGGGNEAPVYGNTNVNIGTETEVYVVKTDVTVGTTDVKDYYTHNNNTGEYTLITDENAKAEEGVYYYKTETVLGANVTGNVYGGGNLADVGETELKQDANGKDYDDIKMHGYTYVNIGAVLGSGNNTDGYNYTAVDLKTSAGNNYEGITIEGNVFGGGKGEAAESGNGAFRCGKAMVTGGTNVCIANGTVKRITRADGTVTGSVYGGGEVGRVEENTRVTIGVGDGVTSGTPTIEPIIEGDVFGAGAGVKTHGYSALVRGHAYVTVQGDAKVGESVYGGGEIASVGKYNVADAAYHAAHPEVGEGMPYSLANSTSGFCYVTVRGNAEIGPDDMQMTKEGGPDDTGHVFGAGKGVLPYEGYSYIDENDGSWHISEDPWRIKPNNSKDVYNASNTEYGANYEAKYLDYIESLALATKTNVTIDGNAFVKGSVYGGSLSGHVQQDTHVTIAGGQIGNGDGINKRYTEHYPDGWPTDTKDITASWAECAHWTYNADNDMPYDPYAKFYNSADGKYYYGTDFTESYNDSKGGSNVATDGHTYYGNVFGGGSGVVPYAPGKWHREAGSVGGNTVVDITGGHILTSVYGGNEHTDVGTYDRSGNSRKLLEGTGKCTINMIGGTVGVPRIKTGNTGITSHPVTCYVFGAGKGDSRVSFNKWTNVGETEVNISGNARIYGSTFGGGEDGHVLGDVETNIGGTVTIDGTDHDYPTTINAQNPGVIIGTQGLSGADGNIFGGGRGFSEEALTAGVVCGNVTVNIHNGKMLGTVFGGGRLASVGTHLDSEGGSNYGKLIPDGKDQVIDGTDLDDPNVTHGTIQINIDGGTIGATDAQTGNLLASDYSIGDVFGGCKGAGSDKRFGLAKRTIINMTDGIVNGNVYGGGELGYVGEATYNETTKVYTWNEESANGGLCTVGISGGEVKGNVFGAGKGLADDFDCEKALVRTTSVTISGTDTSVGGNVYGGGEVGRVDQDTEVTIGNSASDGAGTEGGTDAVISGSVFGAGAGVETHGYSALVRGDATVTIQGNASVGHSIYGGGMIASVGRYGLDGDNMPNNLVSGGDCTVTVKGYSVIGSSGEGHVFGAGMGINPFDGAHNFNYTNDTTNPNNKKNKPKRMAPKPAPEKMPELYDLVGNSFIWEYYTSQDDYFKFLQTLALATDTYVTIEGNASVHGSVYGGSESGFVQRETDVKIQGSAEILTVTENNTTTDGNVFGGGRGVSGFDMAGRVRGNATTTIGGSSTVNGTVYGGGELGFVGKFTPYPNGRNYEWKTIENQSGDEETTGLCTVLINSATAEVKGDVFGAGKGEAITFKCEPAMTKTTNVSVSAGTVGGNVYGGGEVGRVDQDTRVTIGAATGESTPHITGSVFGAGAGLGTHGYSALVRGNTYVTVQNHATVGHSVYGGGEIASVGKYGLDLQKMPSILLGGGYCYVTVKGNAAITGDVFGAGQGITPNFDNDNADRAQRSRRMTMYNADDFPSSAMISAETGTASGTTTQGTTWEYYELGSPYVWEYFQEESKYLTYLETLALATHPEVTIEGNATIGNDVYGGGERGITKGTVIVNINGGTITKDVYGGGALANTNTTSTVGTENPTTGDIATTTVHPTTTVNLHGGVIGHNVYGGGLGSKPTATNPAAASIAALVYGNVFVNLNERPTVTEGVANFPDNCVVKGVIHGANNYNGSPQKDVTVHVYKTATIGDGWTEPKKDSHGAIVYESDGTTPVLVTHKKTAPANLHDENEALHFYDLKAVYGGGNEATYNPAESTTEKHKTHVIIDGCDDTSIETVYGGGNAASVPASYVEVNSCYEIGTVFGGGNGKDDLDDGSENLGAHVGYKADGTTAYGTGEALAELHGGTIHSAFGGSNTKGNVRTSGTVTLDETDPEGCPLCIEEVYGAGNEADQEGTSNINLGCLSYLREMYGGAKNADINNDIELNIQSGRFDRVFGGNNLGGDINGSITVNIEETGCHPIIIGQLFGGGNQAAYTVPSGKHGPTVNVKSFTSIGEIYGGGYGESAVIHGDTYVNINEYIGDNATMEISETAAHTGWSHFDVDIYDPATGDRVETKTITLEQPTHDYGAIGSIGNVFGGGNEADVDGNTNVRIGNMSYVPIASVVAGTTDVRDYYILSGAGTEQSPFVYTQVSDLPVSPASGVTYYVKENENYNEVTITAEVTDVRDYYTRSGEGTEQSPYVYTLVSNLPVLAEGSTKYYKPVLGANITGNVYGGGNAADVTGDTNVVIGREVDATP